MAGFERRPPHLQRGALPSCPKSRIALFFKKTKKNYKLWEKLANMHSPKPNRYVTSIVLT